MCFNVHGRGCDQYFWKYACELKPKKVLLNFILGTEFLFYETLSNFKSFICKTSSLNKTSFILIYAGNFIFTFLQFFLVFLSIKSFFLTFHKFCKLWSKNIFVWEGKNEIYGKIAFSFGKIFGNLHFLSLINLQ